MITNARTPIAAGAGYVRPADSTIRSARCLENRARALGHDVLVSADGIPAWVERRATIVGPDDAFVRRLGKCSPGCLLVTFRAGDAFYSRSVSSETAVALFDLPPARARAALYHYPR